VLANEPTPEANRYGVGSASCLKLRQQVPDVRLDGLLREEETLADLPIDEAVRDELKNLDLSALSSVHVSGIGAAGVPL